MCQAADLLIHSCKQFLLITALFTFLHQELKTPMFKGIVVAGEASESDEEINTTDVNTSLPPLKGEL